MRKLIVCVATILLMVAAILFIDMPAESTSQNSSEHVLLTCDKPVVNVGKTRDAIVKQKFKVTNAGSQTIQIRSIHKSCGCIDADLPKYELAPSESTFLTLAANVRFSDVHPVSYFAEEVSLITEPALVNSVTCRLEGVR